MQTTSYPVLFPDPDCYALNEGYISEFIPPAVALSAKPQSLNNFGLVEKENCQEMTSC